MLPKSTNAGLKKLKLLFSGLLLTSIFISCKGDKSDLSNIVFTETQNSTFKKLDQELFKTRMQAALIERSGTFSNPQFMQNYYASVQFEPTLLINNIPQRAFYQALEYLKNAGEHGLSNHLFEVDAIELLLNKIYQKEGTKNLEEAYQLLIDLELTAANAFSNYSNTIQFGLLNPFKVYKQFYIATPRPDSSSFAEIFKATALPKLLDSIQPKTPKYTLLKQELAKHTAESNPEIYKKLMVNLERMRWKNQPSESKYVWVNIPDYTLDVIENNKSILHMKVCVGESRIGNDTNYVAADRFTNLKDLGFSRETPQLKSFIHSVQVNPVWNIPVSIATNEIVKQAAIDPHYLTNKGIDVFKDGKLIEDSDLIDFNAPNVGKHYAFKQRPGNENSLGKIKFLFNNHSSVYLHDTPSKQPFNYKVRAVSHGCIRVEKPLELAKALFNEKKSKTIEEEMQSTEPIAKYVGLNDKTAVYLSYYTAWVDTDSKIQYRADVYGLDDLLYNHLQMRLRK